MSSPEKFNKYSNIKVDYKLWITDNDHSLMIDEQQFRLLKEIENCGSLKKATERLGISYRKAWGDLHFCEEKVGFCLLDKQRGGPAGGRTFLTEDGKKLVEAYERLTHKFQKEVNEIIIEFKRTIKGKS